MAHTAAELRQFSMHFVNVFPQISQLSEGSLALFTSDAICFDRASVNTVFVNLQCSSRFEHFFVAQIASKECLFDHRFAFATSRVIFVSSIAHKRSRTVWTFIGLEMVFDVNVSVFFRVEATVANIAREFYWF